MSFNQPELVAIPIASSNPLDTTEEQRWTKWKLDGARLDLRRKERMRSLIAAICLAAAGWIIWVR
jgi:hypothetical protein